MVNYIMRAYQLGLTIIQLILTDTLIWTNPNLHLTDTSQYQTCPLLPPPCSVDGTTFSPKFWKGGIRKKWVVGEGGVLKSPCHRYLPRGGGGGLSMFLAKKDSKIKYGFEGLIFKCPPWPVLAKEQINF